MNPFPWRVAFVVFAVLFFSSSLVLASTPPSVCRFAPSFTVEQLATSQAKRDEFIRSYVYYEGNFHSLGTNGESKVTYDGQPLDYDTGEKSGDPHTFSAPSKESLHLAMLALALDGNKNALTWVLNTDESEEREQAKAYVLDILEKKINAFEKFNNSYPGYGCWLPWYEVHDNGLKPTWDWGKSTPSLDSGEMMWSIYAIIESLKGERERGRESEKRERGKEKEKIKIKQQKQRELLAERYQLFLDCMSQNLRMMFYDGKGIRTVVNIRNNQALPSPSNYFFDSCLSEPCHLDDTYEGELVLDWIYLYDSHFNQTEKNQLWGETKRKKIQLATLQTTQGPISTERGWWFSAHEKWKYLLLPYRLSPTNNRVFMNGERARTWFSASLSLPGLFASVNVPVPNTRPTPSPPYLSATGIQPLSFEKVLSTDVFTPYGVYPVLLAQQDIGIAWLAMMLNGTKMQNQYGSTESFNMTNN
eukprot:TRINITY_DN383_c0_g1_i2.p1 TRINITY_DN383_c0_g1~~TRINITY_DN383_c0_g1_i2.p1  ORF type:complete len:474 (-),score=123.43 TRINITY_DN383_c0_g1_i2:327-1748(-)